MASASQAVVQSRAWVSESPAARRVARNATIAARMNLGPLGAVDGELYLGGLPDTAEGLFLDLTSKNGGTVLIAGFTDAGFDATDVVL